MTIKLTDNFQIAIDGPASSGKSTIAKILADNLDAIYIDTGAMYRMITLFAKKNNIDYSDEEKIEKSLNEIEISFVSDNVDGQKAILNNEDVTYEIRTPEITNNVSLVSSYSSVRREMTDLQRKIAKNNKVIMDGRDIGSTVLPNAQLKIYLIASVDERANRRFKENKERGINTEFDVLKKEIEERDFKDSNRENSPLTKTKDAIEIDTSGMTIDQVVKKIESLIKIEL